MSTLIIGARGRIGSRVLHQLCAAGETVRASVRDAGRVRPDVPTVTADLDRPESLPPALDGIERVFLYATPKTVDGFIAAAERAGVKRVAVVSSGSVMLAKNWGNPIAEHHRVVEEALRASTMTTVPIRPLVLASNALNWAPSIRVGSVVRLPYPQSVVAPIHEDDVAAVAVVALSDPDRVPEDSILTGPDAMTQRRQVAQIAEILGGRIAVEELAPQQWRTRVGRYLTPAEAVGALDLLARASADGDHTDDVAEILGRPATSFRQWVRDHVGEFRQP